MMDQELGSHDVPPTTSITMVSTPENGWLGILSRFLLGPGEFSGAFGC